MKRIFITAVLLTLAFHVFGQPKLELNKNYVTTDNLRLRNPYGEKVVLVVLNKGTKVKITSISKEKEIIDGIDSNWVTVEVQEGASDKDGNPLKVGVVGKCFGGYLKETSAPSRKPDFGGGNGTFISEKKDGGFSIVVRKHNQSVRLGEMTRDFNIYSDVKKSQVLATVTLDDKIEVKEIWVARDLKDNNKSVWMKSSYKGTEGFVDTGSSWEPYENGAWEILERIQVGNKVWTARKVQQVLCVYSKDGFVEVRDKPGKTGTVVIGKLRSSYSNGSGPENIQTEAITEENEEGTGYPWVRITLNGKSGWVEGRYLSAERGGPTYYIPDDWIQFHLGDLP